MKGVNPFMETVNSLGKRQIIAFVGILVVVVAITLGVFLVQRQQQLKSQASSTNFISAFEIKDANGNLLNCRMTTPGTATCDTTTLNISVRVKDTVPLKP